MKGKTVKVFYDRIPR